MFCPARSVLRLMRLVIRGQKHELGLGSVHLVSLAEAREQALANRKLARAGGDPLADKRRLQGMPTFAEAAVTVIEQKRAALEVLDAARSLADGNPLVFPNRWSNRIRDTFLSQLLKDLDIAAVPHGFRSNLRGFLVSHCL